MINGIVSFFGGIINWFKGMFNNWINGWRLMIIFIAGVPGAIITLFTSLPGKMLNVGLDIVKGIGKGITNGVSWLKNRIREFVGNVTSFIKKMFKIGSPSKLMAQQVGQWLPKGIGVGITANTDSVYDAMDEMQEGIMSTYGLSPQMTNSMGMHYSPNVNVYNNVDVSTDPIGQTVSQIKTFSGGARNDYNYGMGA
jgi:phage-related protein